MRVLLSAFSCHPGWGSEPEVGFRSVLAAAARHEVWVLTRAVSLPMLRRALADHAQAARIHLEAVPYDFDEDGFTRSRFHWNYDRWQQAAAGRALELDRRVGFDVVHHVTFSTVWTRVGVAAVAKPLVWGPVGGVVETPLRLLPELGVRGLGDDLFRVLARRALARLPRNRVAGERAAVVLAQNHESLRRLRTRAPAAVLPAAAAVDLDEGIGNGERTREILLVGRNLAWKGGHLALRALKHVRRRDAVLRVFGEGPDRARMLQAVRRWGLTDRVEFEPRVPRDQLLKGVARAGVLLHPSFHDDAPLAVGEALSFGTPVVCLDHGGAAEVARLWPKGASRLVRPSSPEATARRMAEAIEHFLADPAPVPARPIRPNVSFRDVLLRAYEQAAAGVSGPADDR